MDVKRRGASRARSASVENWRTGDFDRVLVDAHPGGENTVPPVVASSPWHRPSSRRMRAIRDRLRLVYGVPVAKPHGHPIAELVLTVLSQSTNDRNRDVAYLRLRDRFEDWEAVRGAPVDEIEEAIRPGGISKGKSVRIKAMLEAIGDP